MFRLSRAAEYAVRGLLHLAMMDGASAPADIETIAKAQDAPKAYLSKLFQQLAKKGFVRSVRGPVGGFVLARRPADITLLEVIEAMEGQMFLNSCLIHEGCCPRGAACPVHEVWGDAQKKFLRVLQTSTLARLAARGRKKAEKGRE
ncbi:MAG: Rrf2 family transcriptional regulator [Deltaproteobacteria bacterium]|nr:Rrf2 family transcriptional regulator [Deltaproteobacteria bacterium]